MRHLFDDECEVSAGVREQAMHLRACAGVYTVYQAVGGSHMTLAQIVGRTKNRNAVP